MLSEYVLGDTDIAVFKVFLPNMNQDVLNCALQSLDGKAPPREAGPQQPRQRYRPFCFQQMKHVSSSAR